MVDIFLSKTPYFDDNQLFHIVTTEQEDVTPPHRHAFFELAYIENGSCINIVNDVEQLLKKGDFFILDPTTIHSFRKLGNEKLIVRNCLFLPELIDNTLKDSKNLEEILNNFLIKVDSRALEIPPYLLIFHDKENAVRNIFQMLQKEHDARNFAYLEMARTLLVQIIIFALRELDTCNPLRRETISKLLIDEIEKDPQSDRILQIFSKKMNYSTSYVSRKFKEETGHTFISHLQKYRIELSCRLLVNTDFSIGEIVEKTGYCDWVFFHKLFKSVMNCTPNEYRKRYRSIPGK